MLVLESLVSNTTVVGFKNGGTESWTKDNCYLYEYGDINSVVQKIKEQLSFVSIKEDYSYLTIAKEYLSLIK